MFEIIVDFMQHVLQIIGKNFIKVFLLFFFLYFFIDFREPSKYECVCDPGYFGDGFVCTPEENCLNVPALCHSLASCHSTTSGLKCICNQGKLFFSSKIVSHKTKYET